ISGGNEWMAGSQRALGGDSCLGADGGRSELWVWRGELLPIIAVMLSRCGSPGRRCAMATRLTKQAPYGLNRNPDESDSSDHDKGNIFVGEAMGLVVLNQLAKLSTDDQHAELKATTYPQS